MLNIFKISGLVASIIYISANISNFNVKNNGETRVIEDINNLHSFSYVLDVNETKLDAGPLILLENTSLINMVTTINFESNYLYSPRKDVLIQAKENNISIKELAPIFDELSAYDSSFTSNKIIDSSNVNNKLEINVDGETNKFGVYALFISSNDASCFEAKLDLTLDKTNKIFNFHFLKVNNPTYEIKYFESLDELYKLINEGKIYEKV